MSRFLTPSKIGLLVLTTLYCEIDVTGNAALQLLSFVTSHICPPSLKNNVTQSQLQCTIDYFEAILSKQPSPFPGRTLFDAWIKRLWSIDSLHAFHHFFESLSSYVAEQHSQKEPGSEDKAPAHRVILSRVSPLGQFVRRARLELTRMQFDDVVKLWTSFQQFRSASEIVFKRKNPRASLGDESISAIDPAQDLDGESWISHVQRISSGDAEPSLSKDDLDHLLEFQLNKFQKFGTRMPVAARDTLQSAVDSATKTPQLLSFVRFFDAWKSGDYYSSLDHLHRYFDSTMQAGDRTCYQYALLHMAILQADFDCFSEALAAMNETIAIARENQDMDCLNFSLSWLNHLSQAQPGEMRKAGYVGVAGMEKAGVGFLKAKAKESGNWGLLSSTLMSEASVMLMDGEPLSLTIEKICQAGALNLNHGLESQSATQLLLMSGLLARVGYTNMATAYSDLALDCYLSVTPEEEISRARCSQAILKSSISRRLESSSSFKNPDNTAPRNLKIQRYLDGQATLLRAKRAFKRDHLHTTSSLLVILLQHPSLTPDQTYETLCLQIEYEARLENFSRALELQAALADSLTDTKADLSSRTDLQILRATVLAQSGHAEKGFSALIRAAQVAMQKRVLPLLWKAVGELANILCAMGEYEGARELLEGVLPQALSSSDANLITRLYILQADAHAGLARESQEDLKQRQRYLAKADGFLEAAMHHAHLVCDVQSELSAMAKRSLIARVRGDAGLAEDWAQKYLALRRSNADEEDLAI